MEYGAIHQFGGTSDMPPRLAAIPARPFLGLSDNDEKEVIEILSEFLIN
jgi:phage virion morphogenesis protein